MWINYNGLSVKVTPVFHRPEVDLSTRLIISLIFCYKPAQIRRRVALHRPRLRRLCNILLSDSRQNKKFGVTEIEPFISSPSSNSNPKLSGIGSKKLNNMTIIHLIWKQEYVQLHCFPILVINFRNTFLYRVYLPE